MWETHEVFYLLAVAQVVLLAAVLLREHRRDPSARASTFLLLTVAADLLLPVLLGHGVPLPIVHLMLVAGGSVPFAFWLLSEVHFDDDFRFRPLHGAVLTGLLAVTYFAWLVVAERRLPALVPEAHHAFWALAPKLLSLALVIHALLNVYVGARSDLVLPRLRLRYLVLSLSGTYMLLERLAEALLGGGPRALAELVHSASACILICALSFLCLRVRPEALRPLRPVLDTPTLDPALADRLRQLIEVEQVFREEGLMIAGLAERLGVHEYKVRQLINAQLGFKNFNNFLHHYRIREAQKVLGDRGRAHLGVAQIAYEVGYRSLGPFNKAFKESTGQTPTEFRAATRA